MLYCDWAVLENTDDFHVREREAYWVKHFLDLGCDVLNKDNICRDGLLGHSEETRRKISEAHKGKKIPAEIVAKVAEAKRGVPNPHKGFPHSVEAKLKIGQASKGNQYRVGKSPWNKGLKVSQGPRGPLSAAHRKSLSEAQRLRFQVDGVADSTRKKLSKAALKQWKEGRGHSYGS